ncbi:MAG TPA: GtrA family protein [Rudaea sp.]|jgi:putative flippase GtrA
MRILADGLRFSLVGAAQVAIDSMTYIVLTQFGLETGIANVCARCAGAMLGFWLNGVVTFCRDGQPRLRMRLARYLILWTVLTFASTVSLIEIAASNGLASTWWCKPLIEITLGVGSFILSRHWVYRRRPMRSSPQLLLLDPDQQIRHSGQAAKQTCTWRRSVRRAGHERNGRRSGS